MLDWPLLNTPVQQPKTDFENCLQSPTRQLFDHRNRGFVLRLPYPQQIIHQRPTPRAYLYYLDSVLSPPLSHPFRYQPYSAQLPKDLRDLWRGNEVAGSAKLIFTCCARSVVAAVRRCKALAHIGCYRYGSGSLGSLLVSNMGESRAQRIAGSQQSLQLYFWRGGWTTDESLSRPIGQSSGAPIPALAKYLMWSVTIEP